MPDLLFACRYVVVCLDKSRGMSMSMWVLRVDPIQAPQLLCQLPVQALYLPAACELQRMMQIQIVT